MSARQLAVQASIRAICEAETTEDDARSEAATNRSIAWSAIATNLHPDIPDEFVTRLRSEYV